MSVPPTNRTPVPPSANSAGTPSPSAHIPNGDEPGSLHQHSHMTAEEEHHSDHEQDGDEDYEGGEGGGESIGWKLFIGQIPQHISEEDLKKIFEPYGAIQELVILRERRSAQHRGCAFLTFATKESADQAIEGLHEKITLHHRPLVVRYAGMEYAPAKLFVGMLARTTRDDEISALFSKYGQVKEVYLMRDSDGNSKGCAFVKMNSREAAAAAIEDLNERYQDGSAPRKLVVKFANTKSKKPKAEGLNQMGQGGNAGGLKPPMQAIPPNGMQNSGRKGPARSGQGGGNTLNPMQQQSFGNSRDTHFRFSAGSISMLHPHSNQMRGRTLQQHTNFPIHAMPMSPHLAMSGLGGLMQAGVGANISSAPSPHLASIPNTPTLGPSSLPSPMHTPLGMMGAPRMMAYNQYGGYSDYTYNPYIYESPYMTPSSPPFSPGWSPMAAPMRGPSGSNLFVHNLPETFGDAELHSLFSQFGHIFSTRVFTEPSTGRSRGFGFVSFDNPISAERAIAVLDGYVIGDKQIKVMMKKSKKSTKKGGRNFVDGSETPIVEPLQSPDSSAASASALTAASAAAAALGTPALHSLAGLVNDPNNSSGMSLPSPSVAMTPLTGAMMGPVVTSLNLLTLSSRQPSNGVVNTSGNQSSANPSSAPPATISSYLHQQHQSQSSS